MDHKLYNQLKAIGFCLTVFFSHFLQMTGIPLPGSSTGDYPDNELANSFRKRSPLNLGFKVGVSTPTILSEGPHRAFLLGVKSWVSSQHHEGRWLGYPLGAWYRNL